MKFLEDLKQMHSISILKGMGAEIFVVGGIVRDYFLDVPSKDIDIVIRNLDIDTIEKILVNHGFVKSVGKKFGILIFKPHGWEGEDIDIALPRTEKKIGTGHKGFEILSDHKLTIEEDLGRRDIKFNSIAVSLDGKIIDPFDGLSDIRNKIIRCTSEITFVDDPLRMLRLIRFASILNFKIETKTFKLIKQNAHSIEEISGERIAEELIKIFKKGDRKLATKLLIESGILEHLTKTKPEIDLEQDFTKFSFEDFLFTLFSNLKSPDKFLLERLKRAEEGPGLKALKIFKTTFKENMDKLDERFYIIDLLKKSDSLLSSHILLNKMSILQEFIDKKIPYKITDLAIDGDVLMKEKGFKEGKELGMHLNYLFKEVVKGNLSNNRETLLK